MHALKSILNLNHTGQMKMNGSLFSFAVCFALLHIGATMAVDASDIDTDSEV